MNRIFVLSLGFVFFSANELRAQEAPQAFRDWTFERKEMAAPLGASCVASTTKKVGELTWRLSIVYNPALENATQIVVSTDDLSVENKVVYTQTDSSKNIQRHFRSEFLDQGVGARAFWFAPSSFVDFYSYIRRGTALKLKYVQETEKQVLFSLMGSTAATNKISELCNNKKAFVPESFYNYVDKLNVSAIPADSSASVPSAWDDLGDAWDSYLETGVVQADINEVQKKIDPLVAREREYLRQSGLLNNEIQSQEKTKSDLEALVVTQKAQLKKAQEDLVSEDARLQAALIVLKEKEDVFRTAREEGRPYFNAVDSDQQRVSTLSSQVSSTKEKIRVTKIEISNLWDEVSTLESRIRSLQQQVAQLRTDRIRANNEYLSYNVEWELERKLNSDVFYQQKLRAKQSSDRDLVLKKNELNRAEASLRDLERDLRSCQNQPDRDCSALQNQVNAQRNEVSRAQQQYNSELGQNAQLERDIASRSNQLRRVAEDEKRALANKVADLDVKISQYESAISQNEFKLNTLRNSDIPREERALASAENTLVIQQGQLDTARNNLRRSEQDLAAFKVRTDYDRKERDYAAADKSVRDIRSRMAALDSQISMLKTAIARNESKITSIAANIEKLISQLAATQSELQSVQAALAPLMDQKKVLLVQLSKFQEALSASATDFRVNLRDISVQKTRMPAFPAQFHDWL
ncbi:MAG: hypothetical protein R3A80_10915 [Bdellovibrionota bacterium]